MIICSCLHISRISLVRWKCACFLVCLLSFIASAHSPHSLLAVPYIIGFGISCANLRWGAWGDPMGRFHCDVRGMLCGGYDVVYATSYVCFVSLALGWILYHVQAPLTLCVMTACFAVLVLSLREKFLFYTPPSSDDLDGVQLMRDIAITIIPIKRSVNAIFLCVVGCMVVTACTVVYIATHPHHEIPFGLAYVITLNEMWGPFIVLRAVRGGIETQITREVVSTIMVFLVMVSLRVASL